MGRAVSQNIPILATFAAQEQRNLENSYMSTHTPQPPALLGCTIRNQSELAVEYQAAVVGGVEIYLRLCYTEGINYFHCRF